MLNEEIQSTDIASVDNKTPIEKTFQQISLPSLGRYIFPVVNMAGPKAGVFNLRDNGSKLSLVRKDLEVFDSEPIRTEITQEAIQDMESMYGGTGAATQYVAKMFKGLANDQENKKTLEFLKANCVATDNLTLQAAESPETNMFFLIDKIARCTLKINEKYARSFTTWAVLPQRALGCVMAIFAYQRGMGTEQLSKLFVADTGSTTFYMNPESNDTNVYVGIKSEEDPSRSSAFFGSYKSELKWALNNDTGSKVFWIYNRFGICASPLHTEVEPMMVKFKVTFE